jgi:hypothetical protein
MAELLSPNEEIYWWVKGFSKEECPEHDDEDDICPTCNGTGEVIQDNVSFCNLCKAYDVGVSLGGYYEDLPCDCHDEWGYDWDNGTVDWMEHEDFLMMFPTEESYNKMLQEHNANPPCCPNSCATGDGNPDEAYKGCTFKAESFEAENDNKLHVLMKENTVDNQYGKHDGEEYFEMHISQSQEELRGKVKEYLDDLISGDEIDDYLEKIGPFPSPIDYDAKEAEIRAKINSPNTPLSDLFNLLNEMSEALEGSRGDYGERYSYYTSKDKVLTVSGVNPDALYMAESFDAEYSVDKLSKMSFKEIDRKSGFLGDMLANLGVMDSWTELSKSKRKEILNKIKKKESWLGWEAESFDADFDNAPYESFDEALADSVSFPEKEYEIDDRDIYNPERAAMDMIRSNRALREQMEEQGVYVGRHPGYYDDNGQWVELMEHYDDYERIPNWLQGLVGVGLVGGLAFLLNKMTNTFADTGNNTTEPTE